MIIEIFFYFYDEFLEKTLEFSKEFAKNRYGVVNYKFTKIDLYKYIFVHLYLSLYNVPEIKMLWEKDIMFSSIVPRIISKKNYEKINKYLYISKYSDIFTSDLKKENIVEITQKLDFLVSYYDNKWKAIYPYTKYITIDEAMCSYKGNICIKQYMKEKHKKFGIKFFAMASSDKGYVYEFIPYSGKNFNYDKKNGIGASILIEMCKKLTGNNQHITFDNYYANIDSFSFLYNNKFDFTCTFTKTRKSFPEDIRNIKLKKGENKLYKIKNTNILLFIINDKKQINLASNKYNCDMKIYQNNKGKYKKSSK